MSAVCTLTSFEISGSVGECSSGLDVGDIECLQTSLLRFLNERLGTTCRLQAGPSLWYTQAPHLDLEDAARLTVSDI